MTRLTFLLLVLLGAAGPAAWSDAQEPGSDDLLQERFSQYDQNGDGVLTPDEIDPQAPFDKLDADRDGKVTLEEARQFMRQLGLEAGASVITETIAALQERFQTDADIPPRHPIGQRVAQRSFPSVFMAWSPATNLSQEDRLVTMARHDLAFVGAASFGLQWNSRPEGLADGFQASGIPRARAVRAQLQSLNPNFILLAEIRYHDAGDRYLPADHPWWKRDAQGDRIVGWEEGNYKLLDVSHPELHAQVARQAVAVMETGVFDGVMLDWWEDDADRLALVREVRRAIGDEALILVNANDRQTPQTAPYINGYFMECWRSKTREDWDRIAATLRFAETHLREPRINCLETWYAESRQDLNRMRATTCLALTHSNGYCLFSDPNDLPAPDHLHDWYPFWERQLGQPMGDGELLGDGSARREFQHGTAVYNPLGNAPMTIRFDEPRLSLATGKTARQHVVPPLDGDIFLSGPIIRSGLVDWKLRERGAHLMEDFQLDKVDTKRWRIWHSNPERVTMAVTNGRLAIQGRNEIGHNGLWQLGARRYKDVSLVARFDIRSTVPRTHDLCLHLCGGDMPWSPDHWVEMAVQDLGDGTVLFRPAVAAQQDEFQQSQKSLVLPRGDDDGFLGRVSLDGSANLCSLEVRDSDGKWHPIIDPTLLLLRTTHCEIKMRGEGLGQRDADFSSEGWFDDVRIYPRAASHPILVNLIDRQGRPIYRRLGESWPPRVHVEGFDPSPLADLVVELWTADGQQRVARIQSNNFGYFMLPVVHESWDVFPVAAKIRLSYRDKSLGEVAIECTQLDGLYPDDVYDLIVE